MVVVDFQLVEPSEPLKVGKIRDSNRTTLISQLKAMGLAPLDLGIAPDRYVRAGWPSGRDRGGNIFPCPGSLTGREKASDAGTVRHAQNRTHTNIHAHTRRHSTHNTHGRTHARAHARTHAPTPTHTHTHTHFLSLCVSLTHTRTHTYTYARTHVHAYN